jgi:hypothetical protein
LNTVGGSGEYSGDNDAHFDGISVFYHEAVGGKRDSDSHVNHARGKKTEPKAITKGLNTISSDPL